MTTIYTFAQSAIEEARSAGRYGTANLYSGAINSFRNFTGDIPLTFKEVTAGMIKRYEESLFCVVMFGLINVNILYYSFSTLYQMCNLRQSL